MMEKKYLNLKMMKFKKFKKFKKKLNRLKKKNLNLKKKLSKIDILYNIYLL